MSNDIYHIGANGLLPSCYYWETCSSEKLFLCIRAGAGQCASNAQSLETHHEIFPYFFFRQITISKTEGQHRLSDNPRMDCNMKNKEKVQHKEYEVAKYGCQAIRSTREVSFYKENQGTWNTLTLLRNRLRGIQYLSSGGRNWGFIQKTKFQKVNCWMNEVDFCLK